MIGFEKVLPREDAELRTLLWRCTTSDAMKIRPTPGSCLTSPRTAGEAANTETLRNKTMPGCEVGLKQKP